MKSSNLWYKYVMLCLILWQVWEFPESFQQYIKIEKACLKACNSFHGLCLKKRCHSKLLKDQIKKKVTLEIDSSDKIWSLVKLLFLLKKRYFLVWDNFSHFDFYAYVEVVVYICDPNQFEMISFVASFKHDTLNCHCLGRQLVKQQNNLGHLQQRYCC